MVRTPPQVPRPLRNEGLSLAVASGLALAGLALGLASGWGLAVAIIDWPTGLWRGLRVWGITTLCALPLPSALADLLPRTWVAGVAAWLVHNPWYYQYLLWLQAAWALALALAGARLGWRATRPRPAIIHRRGRKLLSGREAERAAAEELHAEVRAFGGGLTLHPELPPLSLERETKHMMLLGSTGAGKTTVLYPLMREAIERGDRLFIYDCKGEFTALLDGLIFAPWDARCVAWAVGEDLTTPAEIKSFAANLVQETSDPTWSNGARLVFAGAAIYLAKTKGTSWDFADLLDVIRLPLDELHPLLAKYYPEGATFVVPEAKQSFAFMSVLISYAANLAEIAAGWKGKKKISIKKWCRAKHVKPQYRTLICQSESAYETVSQVYTKCILDAMSNTINSARMEDSKERKIWMYLDEFPQIGEARQIQKFLEIGRSKGVRVILGMQDYNQIAQIYGRDGAGIFSTLVNTTIIGRTPGVEMPEWLTKLIGKRQISKYTESYARDTNSVSEQYVDVEEDVVSPDEFTTLAKATKTGVTMFLMTGGEHVYLLEWPHAAKTRLRESIVDSPAMQIADEIRSDMLALADEYSSASAGRPPAAAARPAAEAPAEADEPAEVADVVATTVATPTAEAPEEPEPEQQPEAPEAADSFLPSDLMDLDFGGVADPADPEPEQPEPEADDDEDARLAQEAGEELAEELADQLAPGAGAAVAVLGALTDVAEGGGKGRKGKKKLKKAKRKPAAAPDQTAEARPEAPAHDEPEPEPER